jgi:hypothetical protein
MDPNQYKVYDKDDKRIAKVDFNTNGLTEEHLLLILKDRFKNGKDPIGSHIRDCLDAALFAVSAGKIKRASKLMSNHGYAELHVDLASGTKLYKDIVPACEGIEVIPVNKLHATIMYDERNPDIVPSLSNKVYKGQIVDVQMLGKVGSKWRSCALILESAAVTERHKELVKEGFKHSYDDLLLHVSLVYGTDSEIAFPIIKQLFDEKKLPESITLCAETWDSIKD